MGLLFCPKNRNITKNYQNVLILVCEYWDLNVLNSDFLSLQKLTMAF